MEKITNESLVLAHLVPMLHTKTVAKIMDVKNYRTLEQWRFRGTRDANGGTDCNGLRWIRIGSLVRYRAEDVQRFIEGDRPTRKKRKRRGKK